MEPCERCDLINLVQAPSQCGADSGSDYLFPAQSILGALLSQVLKASLCTPPLFFLSIAVLKNRLTLSDQHHANECESCPAVALWVFSCIVCNSMQRDIKFRNVIIVRHSPLETQALLRQAAETQELSSDVF